METFCSSVHCRHIPALQQASLAKGKCQQVTRRVLRKRHIHEQRPSAAKASFCSVIGVPVCATLACWQVMLKSREIKSEWSLQMDQIPANPKGAILKGPKPEVNGSRRILKGSPLPPVGDVMVAGSFGVS